MVLLWHEQEPIGICVFCTPAAALALRSRAFGLKNPRSAVALTALNEQLWLLSRVVLHPTYRGAGIASHFVKRACQTCPIPWIETLTALGHINPFFEKAGFRKIGPIIHRKSGAFWDFSRDHSRHPSKHDSRDYSRIYGKRGAKVTQETIEKSRYSQPIYYLFDNRKSFPSQPSAVLSN
ncbi:MAG: GNAT family N-acetyltransferase [Gemmataceae bacterium]|nr:GNAT family N-acetyltransferase [Gemmataceae bacterium]